MRRSAAALVCAILVLGGAMAAPHPAAAFCTTGIGKWSNPNPKTMGLSTTFPSAMRTPLANALAQWNRSGSALTYNSPTYTTNWQVYSFKGSLISFSGTIYPITIPAFATGAESNPHSSGTLLFNSLFSWITGSQNIAAAVADTQTIAVHEVGHFTGLAHPWPGSGACTDGTTYTTAEMASVMTTIATGTRRVLNSDDIDGVTTLY